MAGGGGPAGLPVRLARAVAAAARTLALLAAWAALVVIWVTTCAEEGMAGRWQHAALAALDVALLAVLFLAEGMELAVTDLLDKHPEQVPSPAARRVLADIQMRPHFFLAHRQVFVVGVITFTSLTTSYEALDVPGIGVVSAAAPRFWFSFLLTTLTVLWFAQVTPKRLAIVNSILFLRHSAFVWDLIRLVGLLGLPNPADVAVSLVRRTTPYRHERRLLPSRAVHYSERACNDGYALDRVRTTIRFGRAGRMTVRKRFLALLIDRPSWETHGSIETAGAFAGPPRVRVLAQLRTRVPERMGTIVAALDELFDWRTGSAPRPPAMQLTDCRPRVSVNGPTISLDGRCAWRWVVRGECPADAAGAAAPPSEMVVLLYEVVVDCRLPEQGLETSWSESVDVPCRTLAVAIESSPRSGLLVAPVKVSTASPQPRPGALDEELRLSGQLRARGGRVDIPYPAAGTVYTVHWHASDRRENAPRALDTGRGPRPR